MVIAHGAIDADRQTIIAVGKSLKVQLKQHQSGFY